MPEEKRKFTRVPFSTKVGLTVDDHTIFANEMRNVSLGGALVLTAESLPPGTVCQLDIELIGPASLLCIRVEGEVLRCDPDGMAIKFTRIDLDSLIHLSHLIKICASDPELIDLEYTHNLLEIREP
ncbi:MAG: PilZ domain-containing protein [Desulfomonile tiedjei]|nr:PilZ domain-containing protein [Desulfomonile tiedjei]